MRPTPRRWLALSLLALALFAAGCGGNSAKAVTISPPTATKGDITLTLDRPSYTSHQPVGVTVVNGSKTAWYSKDGVSACTYVQLEWYDAVKMAWTPVDGCTGAISPQIRLIAPGESVPFTLAPGDSPADANAWVPGLYRVSLIASAKPDISDTPTTFYSAGFQINS